MPLLNHRSCTCLALALAALGCGSVSIDTTGTGGTAGRGPGGAGAGGSSSATGMSGGSSAGAGGVIDIAAAPFPWGLAVDTSSLVWTSLQDGTVTRVSLMDGATTVLATAQAGPTAVVLDGGTAWVGTNEGLVNVPLDG